MFSNFFITLGYCTKLVISNVASCQLKLFIQFYFFHQICLILNNSETFRRIKNIVIVDMQRVTLNSKQIFSAYLSDKNGKIYTRSNLLHVQYLTHPGQMNRYNDRRYNKNCKIKRFGKIFSLKCIITVYLLRQGCFTLLGWNQNEDMSTILY